eukprot:Skav225663  [mRNA]  locus=scaffold1924:34610:46403:+ [translate_table: standard]
MLPMLPVDKAVFNIALTLLAQAYTELDINYMNVTGSILSSYRVLLVGFGVLAVVAQVFKLHRPSRNTSLNTRSAKLPNCLFRSRILSRQHQAAAATGSSYKQLQLPQLEIQLMKIAVGESHAALSEVPRETTEEVGVLWYHHLDADDHLAHHQLLGVSDDWWFLPGCERSGHGNGRMETEHFHMNAEKRGRFEEELDFNKLLDLSHHFFLFWRHLKDLKARQLPAPGLLFMISGSNVLVLCLSIFLINSGQSWVAARTAVLSTAGSQRRAWKVSKGLRGEGEEPPPEEEDEFEDLPEPYKDFPDFLRMLRLKRAREISKQRAVLKEAGVDVRVIDGCIDPSAVEASVCELMCNSWWEFVMQPCRLKNGNVEISNNQYRRALSASNPFGSCKWRARGLAVDTESVPAKPRASGWTPARCAEPELEVPFLHFECCYYAAIEHAIANGYERFEPGNGGGSVYKAAHRCRRSCVEPMCPARCNAAEALNLFSPAPFTSFQMWPFAKRWRSWPERRLKALTPGLRNEIQHTHLNRVIILWLKRKRETSGLNCPDVPKKRWYPLMGAFLSGQRHFSHGSLASSSDELGGAKSCSGSKLGTGRQGKTLLVRQVHLSLQHPNISKAGKMKADGSSLKKLQQCSKLNWAPKVMEWVLGKELENGEWTDRLYVISELAVGP